MRKNPVRPRRSLRSEFLSLLPLGILSFALVAVFPFASFRFGSKASSAAHNASSSCAFVDLEEGAVVKAMERVRSSLSVDAGSVRNLRADLSLSTIAEEIPANVFALSERTRYVPSIEVGCAADFLPASMAAAEPLSLESAADAQEKPFFSKEEMLKID